MNGVLRDSPYLLFCLLLGAGLVGAVGISLWAIVLYRWFVWIERLRLRMKRLKQRKSKLSYRDML